MESIYAQLALYGSKNECARTDNVFPPISEVCTGTVSLSGLPVPAPGKTTVCGIANSIGSITLEFQLLYLLSYMFILGMII